MSDKHEMTRGLPKKRYSRRPSVDFLEEALERPCLKTILEEFLQCFDDSVSQSWMAVFDDSLRRALVTEFARQSLMTVFVSKEPFAVSFEKNQS